VISSPVGHCDIFDISDVANGAPLLGTINTGPSAHTSWPTEDGNYVLVARETSGGDVTIWDIHDPANPFKVSTISLPTSQAFSAHQIMTLGNLLYVSWYQAGVRVYDISDPANPTFVADYKTYNGPVSGFNGCWGVYPYLGRDKILAFDIQTGLYVLSLDPIKGTVWNDLDGDGVRDPGEPGLAGWTVFVDLKGTGTFDPGDPFAVTGADGTYSIKGVPDGTWNIYEVPQPSWTQTAPAGGFYTVTLDPSTTVIGGIDFGNQKQVSSPTIVDNSDPGFFTVGDGWETKSGGYNGDYLVHAPTTGLLPNGGFETGNFASWSTTGGPNTVQTAAFGIPPTQGTYHALMSNASGVATGTLELFLGVTPGSLNGLGNGTVWNGSAVQQTFFAPAGATLTFDWDFLTNESPGDTTFDDFAFVAITPVTAGGTLQTLQKVANAGAFGPAPGSTGFGSHTGYHTFSYTFPADATYTLSVGAVNVGDTAVSSAVLLDNAQLSSLGGQPAEAHWFLSPAEGPGNYELYATWVPASGNATNVAYQVYDSDGTYLGTAVANQQLQPNDVLVNGSLWKDLGAFATATGTFQVFFDTSSVSGNVVADALFVTPLPAGPGVAGRVTGLAGVLAWATPTSPAPAGPRPTVAASTPGDGGAHPTGDVTAAGESRPPITLATASLATHGARTLEADLQPGFQDLLPDVLPDGAWLW
jgi:hypothetical protein